MSPMSLVRFSLVFFLCFCFSLSNGASDPNQIYESFLQCLPTQSPHADLTFSSIIYSSALNSSSYTSVLQTYIKNCRYNATSTLKPAIIITPTKESHVQAVVLCTKKLGIQIKIRSGGHDYEGISYVEGRIHVCSRFATAYVSTEKNFIVLDIFNFRTVDVNIADETAVVQVGAQIGELYYRIWEKSKVHGFPAGVCVTVGVGGHISGGGYGSMLRKHGLSVDHVIDARMVDVNGRILDRNSMGEDLFWAIRGGGGASFGVILSYTLKLVSVPEVNTVFRITKTVAENATYLVHKWQFIAPTIDNRLFVRIILEPVTVSSGRTVQATFKAHFLGDSDTLLAIMTKNFPELGLERKDYMEVSWILSVVFWANFDYNTTPVEILLNRHSDSVSFLKRKSDYVQTPISESGMNSIFNKLVELGKVYFVFTPYGGRMNEVPTDATPFPHRVGNLFKIQYAVNWNDDDPKVEENYLNQSRILYTFMTGYVSKNPRGAFLNYRDLDIGVMGGTGENGYKSGKVYGVKYFKGNFERLVKVKKAVDPDNFFRDEQSIPTLPRKIARKFGMDHNRLKKVNTMNRHWIGDMVLQIVS